ncbi:splicing factor U2AF 65 kDa subunit [Babesia microti strain RI]|uniref:Splicing factor U2AF subunit n=1 Tax=Babesia microti (strain RI) TaxID=1133968 RepID=A0A1N6LX60_BABMR|nr:splicing factor U2AF 65 kDa subunit [Babesia microti strain RI]SIO73470.1 splicing factor U2AF 65 kDa subunit [Babesia microti strain RI]|eukprot:XP_021337566.1 splicing factor U2AF 65 kDa subunit [Babesia microti strain RI]
MESLPSSTNTERRKRKKTKWDDPTSNTTTKFSTFGFDSSGSSALAIPAADLDPEAERRHRRLYIGNVPAGSSQSDIVAFLNGALLTVLSNTGMPATPADTPITKCESFNSENRFCFIELRNVDVTLVCLKMDGINYNGNALKISRPSDYVPPSNNELATQMQPTIQQPPRGFTMALQVFKLHIQNIPTTMAEDGVLELVKEFGDVKYVYIIKDTTGQHKNTAFVEFKDSVSLEPASKALTGKEVEGQSLTAKIVTSNQADTLASLAAGKYNLGATHLSTSISRKILSDPLLSIGVQSGRKIGATVSTVVQLLNIVFHEDLIDDDSYQSLLEDIRKEAKKYGTLEDIVIPRPNLDKTFNEGVGKVFLQFADELSSRKAQYMLNGRRFDAKRVVCAAFYPLDKFLEKTYVLM